MSNVIIKWNSKKSTYYDRGQRCYSAGDVMPESVLKEMGEETVDRYTKDGLIAEVKQVDDKEVKRLELLDRAKSLGLNPKKNMGAKKLQAKIDDAEALADLKKEALALGIDPSDDVDYAELLALVDEKKADKTPQEDI